MGNCFGKSSSSSDNFHGEGRTLGAAPTPAPVNQAPKPVPALQPNAGGTALGSSGGTDEPRSAAARAAEERASKLQASAQKGKLSQQLAQQKTQTQADILKSSAEDELKFRQVDQGNSNLTHQ